MLHAQRSHVQVCLSPRTWLDEADGCVECGACRFDHVCCPAGDGAVARAHQHGGGLRGNEAIYVAAQVAVVAQAQQGAAAAAGQGQLERQRA